MVFQEIIEQVESLSIDDQDHLFELIRKRRIDNRRAEIAAIAQKIFNAVEAGTSIKGSFEDLRSYLLSEDDE